MYLAYVDDSGDSGYAGSMTYALGCVFLDAPQWPSAFDALIGMRRFFRRQFGVPVRAEIKANWLIRNSGSFKHLSVSEANRQRIYRMQMRMVPKIQANAFAIVIRKGMIQQQQRDPHDIAWEYLIQRLERLSTNSNQPVLLIHDNGENDAIRKLARKARRAGTAGSAFGMGYLNVPARLLIDDPVPRDSAQNYFIQLADLCAYAAFRRHHPPPQKRASVCPQGTWDELGAARFAAANQLAGGVPGIVMWP